MINKNEEIQLSIIIPVYNTSKYLERCINSIYDNNSSDKIEVIAIDAASTDSSLGILSKFELNKDNFKLIRCKERIHLSKTRVLGINEAKGLYIMHLDSDDWLLPNAVQYICKKTKESSCDTLVFNYVKDTSSGFVSKVRISHEDLVETDKMKIKQHFLSTCWNKVTKRSLLSNLIYGSIPLTIEEDLIYSMEVLLRSNVFYFSSEYIYSYFLNIDSLTHTILPCKYLESRPSQITLINRIFEKYNYNEMYNKFIYNYIEKGIHLELSKIYFIEKSSFLKSEIILSSIKELNLLSADVMYRINLSFKSRFFNLLFLYTKLGYKYFLRTLAINFKIIKINN